MNDLLDHCMRTADGATEALVFVAFAKTEKGEHEFVYFTSGDIDECFALATIARETLKQEIDEDTEES